MLIDTATFRETLYFNIFSLIWPKIQHLTLFHAISSRGSFSVSQYRQEALTLAKGRNSLKASIAELDFTAECQAKELGVLRAERGRLEEALAQAWREKDELLQRWMEDKQEEAHRLNNYNDIEERWEKRCLCDLVLSRNITTASKTRSCEWLLLFTRWQRLTQHLKKHLSKETGKGQVPRVDGGTTASDTYSLHSEADCSSSRQKREGNRQLSWMQNICNIFYNLSNPHEKISK